MGRVVTLTSVSEAQSVTERVRFSQEAWIYCWVAAGSISGAATTSGAATADVDCARAESGRRRSAREAAKRERRCAAAAIQREV